MSSPPPASAGPPPSIGRSLDSENTIKIMLATDHHIGYLERDPIRGMDAINTFKEILQLAVKHDVDFILLAGDLFHENRPSRDCIYRTIALLREYTLGDRPVQVELLSDPDEGKAEGFSFPAINYEDPNFNVGIPVFSIHGNHDDPQGAGPEGALCALDLLSVTGLLNYIGKLDLPSSDETAQTTGIAIKPVLLRKGRTKLGLYGVGNVKDQRMHFELRSNRVRMFMPRDKDDWFNILLVHQNRVKHGPQESVPEGMFDDSIHLVVWGHEHDCRITPEPVAGKEYYITQPGSSVATSLADGESIEKHVALLEIQGQEFQMTPIPLRTVRPFVIDELIMSEAADEGLNITDKIEISKYLRAKVNELIAKAENEWAARNAAAVAEGEPELEPMLPLIRLKVDTTGVAEMSNPVRLSQEFQGRVANPRDVIVFHRAKKFTKNKIQAEEPLLSVDDPDITAGEKLEKLRVQHLVKEYLAAQELQVLGETGMSDAIQMYVEKDDVHSIQGYVSASLKQMLKGVQATGAIAEKDLEDILTKAKERQEKEYTEKQNGGPREKEPAKKKAAANDGDSDDSMAMDIDYGVKGLDGGFDDDDDEEDEAPKKKPAAKSKTTAAKGKAKAAPAASKTAAKGKGTAKKPLFDDDDDEEEEDQIEEDEEEDEIEEAPKPKKSRAAILSGTAAKKAPAKKKAPAASSAKQSTLKFGSETAAAKRPARVAAKTARGKISDETIEISD